MYTEAISSELAAMVFRVAVVGGGAAGLCAARHLAAAGKLWLPGVFSQVSELAKSAGCPFLFKKSEICWTTESLNTQKSEKTDIFLNFH